MTNFTKKMKKTLFQNKIPLRTVKTLKKCFHQTFENYKILVSKMFLFHLEMKKKMGRIKLLYGL